MLFFLKHGSFKWDDQGIFFREYPLSAVSKFLGYYN